MVLLISSTSCKQIMSTIRGGTARDGCWMSHMDTQPFNWCRFVQPLNGWISFPPSIITAHCHHLSLEQLAYKLQRPEKWGLAGRNHLLQLIRRNPKVTFHDSRRGWCIDANVVPASCCALCNSPWSVWPYCCTSRASHFLSASRNLNALSGLGRRIWQLRYFIIQSMLRGNVICFKFAQRCSRRRPDMMMLKGWRARKMNPLGL